MKVVQVTASADYEGTWWTVVFSSVEKALENLRNQPADTFAGIDDIDIAWVGVDDGSYERVLNLAVNFQWGDPDTVSFSRWVNGEGEVPFQL